MNHDTNTRSTRTCGKRRSRMRLVLTALVGALAFGGVLTVGANDHTIGVPTACADGVSDCKKGCYREALRQKRWCKDYSDPRDRAWCNSQVSKDEKTCLRNCE